MKSGILSFVYFCSLAVCCCMHPSHRGLNEIEWRPSQQLQAHQSPVWGVGFSSDDKYFFTCSDTLKIWLTEDGSAKFTVPQICKDAGFQWGTDLLVATCFCSDRDTRRWTRQVFVDVNAEKIVLELPPIDSAFVLPVVSRDKKLIVTATRDGQFRCWDWDNDKAVIRNEFDLGEMFIDKTLGKSGLRYIGLSSDNSTIGATYFSALSNEPEVVLVDLSGGRVNNRNALSSSLMPNSLDFDAWQTVTNGLAPGFTGADDLGNKLFPHEFNGKPEIWCLDGVKSNSSKLCLTSHEDGTVIIWKTKK